MTAEPVFEDGLWIDGDEAWTEAAWAIERARRDEAKAKRVQYQRTYREKRAKRRSRAA